MKKDIRIVFMGTPEFAATVLKKLVEEGKAVVGVITAPDRPSGRGRKLKASAVKEYALSQEIPVLQPTNLKNEDFLEALKVLNANLQIVVAFRMLPKVVWKIPELGTFNLHASLLPKYRGAAPINWAVINNEKITGVTTFFIDEKIDTGEIILSEEVSISPTETVGSLHDTLMRVGAALVLKTVTLIAEGEIKTQPQTQDDTFEKLKYQEAPKLTPENTYIPWHKNATEIDAFIRGLNPYPGAWSYLLQNEEKHKVKIFATKKISKEINTDFIENQLIGSLAVVEKKLLIKLTSEILEITAIQLPGKRKMETKALLNGYDFANDAIMIVNPYSH